MKEVYEIKNIEQLKAIGDPLRIKILWKIIEHSMTGKMIADSLGLPASKIHYHLKELEKAEIVTVERTEEKNGIMQKFYRSVAYQLKIDHGLLPHSDLITDSMRSNILSSLDLSRELVSKAEDKLFSKSMNSEDSLLTGRAINTNLTKDQIQWLQEKMDELVHMLLANSDQQKDNKGKKHHINWIVVPIEDGEEE